MQSRRETLLQARAAQQRVPVFSTAIGTKQGWLYRAPTEGMYLVQITGMSQEDIRSRLTSQGIDVSKCTVVDLEGSFLVTLPHGFVINLPGMLG